MKTLLITGSNGQLGHELRALAPSYPAYRFVFTDVNELDITNRAAVVAAVEREKTDYVVNCAAYTAVDKAEGEWAQARLINALAVQNIGIAAQQGGARVIQVSTDYVFNGRNYRPYVETDAIDPQSVYGQTKAEGEQLLSESCPDSIIVRTSWLYSVYGNNFVKTMMRLGAERNELRVVFDQIGSPTYATDLASALLRIIAHSDNRRFCPGIYHYSNEGVCSWYDFALKIHQLEGIDTCHVTPVESSEYPVPAPRPHYSVLNKAKIKSAFGLEVPHWEEALTRFFACLKQTRPQLRY